MQVEHLTLPWGKGIHGFKRPLHVFHSRLVALSHETHPHAGLRKQIAQVWKDVVEPGRELDGKLRVRARWVMAGAFVMVGLVLYGGKTWWDRQTYSPGKRSVSV